MKSYSKKNSRRGVDYIGVTCVFFCHDGNGRFLLHKRSDNCRDEQGRWDCGAGALKFGENFEIGVKREIKEEYNTDVVDLKHIATTNILRERDGENTHWVALVFAAQVVPEQATINDPPYMDEIGWFTKENLPEPLHSQFHKHFEYCLKEGLA